MTVMVNGEQMVVPVGSTVSDVVRKLGHDPTLPGVAAAVDGVVVPRVSWRATELDDNQQVEVLTAVQGGSR